MSRVAALLTKSKNRGDKDRASTYETSNSRDDLLSSPEKERNSPTVRNTRAVSSASERRSSLVQPVHAVPQSSSTLKHSPSFDGSGPVGFPSTTPDGTPLVFDTTGPHHPSRANNLSLDERALPSSNNAGLRGRKVSRSHPQRGGTEGTATSPPPPVTRAAGETSTTAAAPRAHRVSFSQTGGPKVGEGSLTLDTLITNGSIPEVEKTPRADLAHLSASSPRGQPAALSQQPNTSDVRLFVTDASNENGHTHSNRTSQVYPAVFEHSDVGTSSSSSSSRANSPAMAQNGFASGSNGVAAGAPLIQIERISTRSSDGVSPSRAATMPPSSSAFRPSTANANLQPSALSPPLQKGPGLFRKRSGSFSSVNAASPDGSNLTSPTATKTSRKSAKKQGSGGIASALALSGVALADPASSSPSLSPDMRHTGSQDDYMNTPVATANKALANGNGSGMTSPLLVSRSSEEAGGHSGYDSPTPLSHYTPDGDSPRYDDREGEEGFEQMDHLDALGDLDDVVSQLGAGYALASSKRNTDFHHLFKKVPEDDYLIEDYGCALQREILIQGRLYISEHHLCFYTNLFGWVTSLVLDFNEIIAIEKRNTALVIPNAIHIATLHSRHTFASFLSRDTAYELITSLWRNQHPVIPSSAPSHHQHHQYLTDAGGDDEDEDENTVDANAAQGANNENADLVTSAAERTSRWVGGGRKNRRKGERGGRFKKSKGGTAAIAASENGGLLSDPEVDTGNSTAIPHQQSLSRSLGASKSARAPKAEAHPITSCKCMSGGPGNGHYGNTVMDSVFPGSPEKIYNLMFTSGFMRDFLQTDMKLTDLQISEWAPQKSGSHLLTRTYSYIKPLSAPVGPKSAKCILVDENLHVDFDDHVVTLTTTKTPDVPSGGSFSVKTKTCCMWAKNSSTRIVVTTAVEWTGRSFIKGIIDSSSIGGQKTLYVALEQSMRNYISQHKSEFYEGGAEEQADEDGAGIGETGANGEATGNEQRDAKGLSSSVNRSSMDDTAGVTSEKTGSDPLAFISDAVPALKPVCDFLVTLYDTFGDLLGQMSLSTLICGSVILVLLACNLATFSSLRRRPERVIFRASRSYAEDKQPRAVRTGQPYSGEHAQQQGLEVAEAVRGVLKEYFGAPGMSGQLHGSSLPLASVVNGGKQDSKLSPAEEMEELKRMMKELEGRFNSLRASMDATEVD